MISDVCVVYFSVLVWESILDFRCLSTHPKPPPTYLYSQQSLKQLPKATSESISPTRGISVSSISHIPHNTSRQHPHPHPSPYPIHRVQIYISPIRFTTTASPQQCLPVSAACETLYFHQDQPHSAPAFTQPKTQTYLGTPHQSSLFPSGLQSRGPDDSYPTSRVRVQPQCKRTSLTKLQQCRGCWCVWP